MSKLVSCATLVALVTCFAATNASATILSYSEQFPTADGVPAGWTPFVGSGGTLPALFNSTGNEQTDDDGSGDVAGSSLDGNLDGSLLINSDSSHGSLTNNMGAYLNLAGSMVEGEQYTLTARLYNPNVSFINAQMTLENASDSTILANSGSNTLNTSNGNYRTLILNYTALATDSGDTLQLRFTGLAVTSGGRDLSIDNLSLNVTPIPEPVTLHLLGALTLCGLGFTRRRK